MKALAPEFLPWDRENCDLDECRNHLFAYREGYETKANRAHTIWITLTVIGAPVFFFEEYRWVAVMLWIAAAFARAESSRYAQMVDSLGALWGVALCRSTLGTSVPSRPPTDK